MSTSISPIHTHKHICPCSHSRLPPLPNRHDFYGDSDQDGVEDLEDDVEDLEDDVDDSVAAAADENRRQMCANSGPLLGDL